MKLRKSRVLSVVAPCASSGIETQGIGVSSRFARIVARSAVAVCLLAGTGCSTLGGESVESQQAALNGPGVSGAGLQLKVLTNSCGANQVQDFFQITNTGTSAVKLSDIKVRFWADDVSGQSFVPHVSTGGCVSGAGGSPSCVHQVTGVSAAAATFSPACGSDATHQANWEITVADSDGGLLAPGAVWNNIQVAANLANFSNFNPGASKWFSPCVAGSSYASDPHFAVYYQGALVFSSGLSGPSCRAPHGQQQLTGYLTPAITNAPLVGPVPQDTVINLAFGLPVANPTGLAAQAADVSNPNSPNYRHFLTPDQFVTSYGPNAADYQALTNWAQANGLTVQNTFPNRMLLGISGSVAAIEKALYANLVFRRRADGSQFYGLDREPSLDLSATLLGISGSNNMVLSVPANGSGALSSNYQGYDFRHAYASCLPSTLTGTGQSVGLYANDGFSQADIVGYEMDTGLPNVLVNVVRLGGLMACPDDASGSECPGGGSHSLEIALDIESTIAMAPGLSEVTVHQGPTADSIFASMATRQPLNRQLSSSWIFDPTPNTQQIFDEFAVQGQSFFTAAGDFGSFGTGATPIEPGTNISLNNETIVGGTALNMTTNGAAYISEAAWPSGGGGILSNLPLPYYQSGVDMSSNNGSLTHRNVPDVSMVASDCEFVTTTRQSATQVTKGYRQGGVGGTSIAAPLWAGFTALINQQNQINGLGPVGFLNPVVYALGKSTSYGSNFNDIQTDGNGGYQAVPGYDLATGWGSPKCALIGQLSSSSPVPNLAVVAGSNHFCALRSDHSVWCWGNNDSSQLGNAQAGLTAVQPVPVAGLPGGGQVSSIAAGGTHTCALLADQTVWCWGSNGSGELGSAPSSGSPTPVQVNGLSGVSAISLGNSFSCALLQGKTVKCWGHNPFGQLGNNSTTDSYTPVDVSFLTGVTSFAAGPDSACAVIGADSHVVCWGLLLNHSNTDPTNFQVIPNPVITGSFSLLDKVSSVAVGASHACARMLDSTVQCWGSNVNGELGDGTTASRDIPAEVVSSCSSTAPLPAAPLTLASKISVGNSSSCAVLNGVNGGSVACWGGNVEGELGDGTTTSRACPAPVSNLSGQTGISSRGLVNCSLNQLGVSCWGTGVVGDGSSQSLHTAPATVRFF